MHRLAALSVASALLLAACGQEEYRVLIVPLPGSQEFQRTTECWLQEKDWFNGESREGMIPPEALQRVARAYGQPVPAEAKGRQRFEGQFDVGVPGDLLGGGFLERRASSLGVLHTYVEHVGGTYDLDAVVVRRQEAVDTLASLISAWLGAEFEGEAGVHALRTFVEGPFRRDLKDALHLVSAATGPGVWAHQRPEEPEDEGGHAVLVSFLVDRGYLPTWEVALAGPRAGADGETEPIDADILLRELGRSVLRAFGRRIGVHPDAPLLSRISERLLAVEEDRLLRFLATSAEGRAALERYGERLAEVGEPDASPAGQLLGVLSRDLLGGTGAVDVLAGTGLVRGLGHVELRLRTGVRPLMTNGRWIEEDGEVLWDGWIPGPTSLPLSCFATWAAPDTEAQQRRFGRVRLEGEALARYVAWYAALPAEQRAAWDRFLDTITQQSDLEAEIERFIQPEPPRPWAEGGANLLLGREREGSAAR